MTRRQSGFTLVETLTAIAISAILLAAVASVGFTMIWTFYKGEVLYRVQREIVYASETIYNEVKLGEHVTVDPVNPNKYTIEGIPTLEGTTIVPKSVDIVLDETSNTLKVGNRTFRYIASVTLQELLDGEEGVGWCTVALESISSLSLVGAEALPLRMEFTAMLRNYIPPILSQ